ncbi:carboxymuconolactone decarboxylase family protein [Candidatus Coxiella mudrowiae]|uniref:carboxymuconolactone decarboxylase family protein n=1 Tax=Candidatus Coxiella mudrowiae TaxID=2054173 RepID=UPI000AEE2F67|nr:carboxymuconolactone decarboxylase family protein [Candidatus Coxiella mudrowiae]
MPANLHMNIIANPGVDKKDFELYYFPVSAINGSGLCIDAHVNTLLNRGQQASRSARYSDYGSPQ